MKMEKTITLNGTVGRVIAICLGIAFILIGLFQLTVTVAGKTVEAQVTNVTWRDTTDSDNDDVLEVTTEYTFEVDGQVYTGRDTEEMYGSSYYPSGEEFIAEREGRTSVTVRYLPFRPATSKLDVNSRPGVLRFAVFIFFIVLGGISFWAGLKMQSAGKASDAPQNKRLSELSTDYITYVDSDSDKEDN